MIKVSISIENNFILFTHRSWKSNDFEIRIKYDSFFICEGVLDFNYFMDLFKNFFVENFLGINNISIIFKVPYEFLLVHSFERNELLDYDKERESVLYFQNNFHINLNEYEFYLNKKLFKTFACKKNILQSIQKCFGLLSFVKWVELNF